VERARIVLLAASGQQDKEIAGRMVTTPKKVSRWRKRFLALGMAGLLKDAPRPGRKPTIGARLTQRVVTMTTRQRPSNATHWSTRTMAAAVGISEASVRRIWRAHGLKPDRVETFKISNDPAFAEKLEDIVGLYLNPPEHALVLCVDEKSQIQALDRTQPGLPLKRGRGATMTHDYKRNGTATLFAALNAANGEVYGLCQERHHTITDLWLRTKKADPRTSYSAVWRLLNALVECGMAHREISPADGVLRYAPVKIECTHEGMACKDCGATISQEGGQHDRVEREGKE
jgi:Fe2+ or Zn2+ uptake regulation protein/transposase